MGIFGVLGYPTAPALVTGVVEAGPAASAGVVPGDRVTSINGRSMRNFAEVQEYVMLRPAEAVSVTVERDGRSRDLRVTTGSRIARDKFGNEARIGTLGVYSNAVALEKLPLSQLPGQAVRQTANTVHAMVVTLGQLVTGNRSVKELGGPLKIAQISGQQASLGWLPFFWLMAVISINLGFINLLPIPLLDGGHLLFYAIEGVRRRPLKPEAQEWAFRTGLAALLALMVFVTFNDLASFGAWKHLGG
jgi:regulator of sigma E protease